MYGLSWHEIWCLQKGGCTDRKHLSPCVPYWVILSLIIVILRQICHGINLHKEQGEGCGFVGVTIIQALKPKSKQTITGKID